MARLAQKAHQIGSEIAVIAEAAIHRDVLRGAVTHHGRIAADSTPISCVQQPAIADDQRVLDGQLLDRLHMRHYAPADIDVRCDPRIRSPIDRLLHIPANIENLRRPVVHAEMRPCRPDALCSRSVDDPVVECLDVALHKPQ